jgi:hypothetical protein
MFTNTASIRSRSALIAALVILALVVTSVLVPLPASATAPPAETIAPEFSIGETTHVGTFYTSDYKYSKNTIYYEVKKEISVNFGYQKRGAVPDTSVTAELQRLDGTEWVSIATDTVARVFGGSQTEQFQFTIKQTTPNVKRYRVHINAFVYDETKSSVRIDSPRIINSPDAVSAEFTVSGTKQVPGLNVKATGKQAVGKSGKKLEIKTTRAFAGKAVIYDGNKKLGTVPVKAGAATYTLSKKLKKGTHNIKVVFTAGAEFAGFYNTQTKTIKVKAA